MHKKIKKNRISKLYNVTLSTIKAEAGRLLYFFTKNKKEDIWLIYETATQCQENGYYLFSYIRKFYPEMKVYYVISKDAPEIKKIKKLGNILYYESFKQILYMYKANKIISTHGLWIIPNELGILKKLTRNTLKAKKIMLNHGVGFLKNGKKFYHKSTFDLNNLIIALSDHHKNIFTKEYGYNNNDVIITGYPRFDNMIDQSEKFNNIITFMPTFRDNEDNIGNSFQLTDLFLTIKKIMLDTRLIKFFEKNNITFFIYLHQNIQKYSYMLNEFSSKNIIVAEQGEYNVEYLLKISKCLITDYSSVLFDFVYMQKPFISYQFDLNKFIASRKEKAFLDFKTDLPGYVVNKHSELVEKIILLSKNNFTFIDEHKNKAKVFFKYNDTENSKRVFEVIKNL